MTNVTVVSTPDDGSCGIGTYTGDLLNAMPETVSINWVTVPLRSPSPFPYLRSAVAAGLTNDPTIHIQHEYGIFGPKSIWSWLFFPILLSLAKIRNTRVIITFHSAWNGETVGPPLLGLKRVYVALNNRLLAASVDVAIFLSNNAAEKFQRSVPVDEMVILPHGVQVETVPMERDEAKKMFNYHPETPLVVEPGYIRWEKGCDAFVEIAKELNDVSFLLAGGCQDNERYCNQVQEAAPSNVKITGELTDIKFHAAFNAADLVLLPYREVTQSGVFNWCVAYGLPVIGSDTHYFRTLREEWACVGIADTENFSTTANCVQELLSDRERREELMEKMAIYRQVASMKTVAKKHEEIYTTAYLESFSI